MRAGADVGMAVGAGVEVVAAVVAVDQVDPAGDGADLVDHGLERDATGMGVAGVEAETDLVGAVGGRDSVEDALDPVEVAGHGVVAAGGVLDQERDLQVGGLDGLAPVVEADGRVVVLVDMAAVDDQTARPDLGSGVHVLLEELARRDPDPVVGGGDVDDVGSVDVETDARGLGVGPQPGHASGVADLGASVALRVAEEELHVRRSTGLRLGDRVGLLDVGSEGEVGGCAHTAIVGTATDSARAGRRWQAGPMNVIVLVVLTLALLGIVVAAGWVVAASLSSRSRD